MDTLQLDIYQLGFYALTRQVAEKLSFYYLRQGNQPRPGAGPVSLSEILRHSAR